MVAAILMLMDVGFWSAALSNVVGGVVAAVVLMAWRSLASCMRGAGSRG